MTPALRTLHEKALTLAKRFRSAENELLDVLIEVETLKAYLPLGFDSLFNYCVNYLKLTRDQSYAFMAVAKKSKEIPELKVLVQNEEMTFSNARKLVSVLTPENKDAWLEKGKTLTQKALEREIVKANPEPPVKERIRPVSDSESELKVGLDTEMEEDLKRIKSILGTGSSKEALKAIMKEYLKRHDPVQKANRVKVAVPTAPAKVVVGARRKIASRYIPKPVFHEVQRRDEGKCQFKGVGGQKCNATFGVQVHHLEPWAWGGRHEARNLLTLCQRHHRYWHEHLERS